MVLGAALLVAGAFSDWATVDTTAGTIGVDGLDRGGLWLLAAALVGVLAAFLGRPEVTVVCAALAAGFLALEIYQLPGDLLDDTRGAFEASIALGADAALLGALVLLGAGFWGLALRRSSAA